MNSLAFLIGFCYKDDANLIGTDIDLYRFYTYCKSIKIDDIYVLTDLYKDPSTTEMKHLITDGIVDAGITNFITDLQRTPSYIFYKTFEIEKVLKSMARNIADCSNFIFYFSGHGKGDNIVFPEGSTYSIDALKEMLLTPLINVPDPQVLWIMDCCHSSDLGLLYNVENDRPCRFRGISFKSYIPPFKMIAILSTNLATKTISTSHGSPFTYYFLDLMNKKIFDLFEIKHKLLNDYPHMQILFSFPSIKSLWPWLQKPLKYRIKYDSINKILIVDQIIKK